MARWRVKSRILKVTKGPGNEVVKLVFHFSYEKKVKWKKYCPSGKTSTY